MSYSDFNASEGRACGLHWQDHPNVMESEMAEFMVLALRADHMAVAPFKGTDESFAKFLWDWWLDDPSHGKDGKPLMFYRVARASPYNDKRTGRWETFDTPASLVDVADWLNEQYKVIPT